MFGVGVIGPNAFSLLFVVLVPPMDDIRKTVFDRKMQLNVPNKWMLNFSMCDVWLGSYEQNEIVNLSIVKTLF